ncbi:MAG: SDR family oxidoreductase [Gemmatimonadetes bacterium]|nr:SDR family oxidoreductase [Gemmatimonadota bacterium]
MDLRIAGKVALVCGSSSGIGRAVAHTFAHEGCRVAMNGRDGERLSRAVEQLRKGAEADVEGFVADVSIPDQVERLVHEVRDRFGGVDILICNAGGPPAVQFLNAPPDSWKGSLELNLVSTINLCRAAVPHMRKRQWGRIICITSVAAKQPMAGLILSTTARAGVMGFAKSLADELASDGITVNVVCPGYVRTERVEDLARQRSRQTKRTTKEEMSAFVADVPVGRMGEPEEVAAAIAFLASQPASYITGVALQVDGGYIRSIV